MVERSAESGPSKQSAGLLLVSEGRLLVLERASSVSNPNRWGLPGGQLRRGEDPFDGAIREATEEVGPLPPMVVVGTVRVEREGGPFDVFICRASDVVRAEWAPRLCHEHLRHRWSKLRWCLNRRGRLHPVVRALLDDPRALEMIDLARLRGQRRREPVTIDMHGRRELRRTL